MANKAAVERIAMRIVRLQGGLLGNIKAVGDGVSEMRIHTGPGYRVYFTQRGKTLIILLGGGDKHTQARDIKAAKTLLKDLLI